MLLMNGPNALQKLHLSLDKSVDQEGQMGNFDLIETMGFDPSHGISRLELHLMRMKESANILGFEFDRHEARNQLHAAVFTAERGAKIRLLLSRSGALAIEVSDKPQTLKEMKVGVVRMMAQADDIRLAHKCSDREIYDAPRRKHPQWDEVLFLDSDGYLTEGSYTNLFVERDGRYITPPKVRGLLPGVLRREMIDSGAAIESDLMEKDLLEGFFVGNSLRGLVKAKLFINPMG